MRLQLMHRLQAEIKNSKRPLALNFKSKNSKTTRSKSYKKGCQTLRCGGFNRILHIDAKKRYARVEPRVTIDQLVSATLPYGLAPAVVPEFKGITIGGAIMGIAAESASHRFGTFNDICLAYEIILGDGSYLRVTPTEHSDIFYGLAGSYGTLGFLVAAEIQLIPVTKGVHLCYHSFSRPSEALEALQTDADFIDGMVFSKEDFVIIEGRYVSTNLPLSRPTLWYAHHVQHHRPHTESMSVYDYFFRYDQGAFWMGNFLFSLPFLSRFIMQGVCKLGKTNGWFDQSEIDKFRALPPPGEKGKLPLMKSQYLWKLLHKAEKWLQDRVIIQDFCIPESQALQFLEEILEDPGTFPLWLCPIKTTDKPQIFAPHFSSSKKMINMGIYGLPSYSAPMEEIIRPLEQKTKEYGGRKVLYSRSYYTPDEFWQIYSKPDYERLREKTNAKGTWKEITEKVLSE